MVIKKKREINESLFVSGVVLANASLDTAFHDKRLFLVFFAVNLLSFGFVFFILNRYGDTKSVNIQDYVKTSGCGDCIMEKPYPSTEHVNFKYTHFPIKKNFLSFKDKKSKDTWFF